MEDLKRNIIVKIALTTDEILLKKIGKLLDSANDVYQLSEEEIAIIKEAQREYQKGNFITDEDLQKELSKWLD